MLVLFNTDLTQLKWVGYIPTNEDYVEFLKSKFFLNIFDTSNAALVKTGQFADESLRQLRFHCYIQHN